MGDQLPNDRLAALEAENAAIKARNKDLELQARLLKSGYSVGSALAALILLGPSLVSAAEAFFERSKEKPFPSTESAALLAAVIRRILSIGLVGLLLALVPIWLLHRQNLLIEEQNVAILAQNAKIQTQIQNQENDNRIVRRAQLLATIYERSDCSLEHRRREHFRSLDAAKQKAADEDAWPAERSKAASEVAFLNGRNLNVCPPKAPLRLRQEAVVALAALDGEALTLTGADLSRINLKGQDLSGADFSGADLTEANLDSAILVGANFNEANLSRAALDLADFSRATLIAADLHQADLFKTKFFNTDLLCALLQGTYLGDAEGLSQAQIIQSCGDSKTVVPKELERSGDWLKRPREPSDIEGDGCDSVCGPDV